MSSRANAHPSLPAPTLHAGYSASQSKSHVLAGVQDAYWSDDEAEDAECPLCLEEMDISDLNFKPCVCGYQICRFCWHHIKENLNGRCPACRREYSEDSVQFKPVNQEDHKRLTQQKKQRERERKDLESLGRRHLANVRVVQRNVVYVVGLGPRFAKEELIPTLRSNEYFGQYGKISKIVIVKRTPPGGRAPVVGLYITYHRREDAARCIAVVDGAPTPGGGTDVMRASYGTTKYCMAFLRGVSCSDHSCMSLHEWGDEKDCFTKEDLTTLKHTMKDTETRTRAAAKRGDDTEGALPRAASWATKSIATNTTAPITTSSNRPTRRGGTSTRQPRAGTGTTTGTSTKTTQQERRTAASHAKTPSQTSSSRPPTPALASLPARPVTPAAETKRTRPKEVPPPLPSPPAVAVVLEPAPLPPKEQPPPPVEPPQVQTPESVASPAPLPAVAVPAVPPGLSAPPGLPAAPPGLPAVPPGLMPPPGLPPLNARTEVGSPQISLQSSYQMSTQARALLDDVKARREVAPPVAGPAPFPDLERTLQTLSEGGGGQFGGFSFNLDPKLAAEEQDEIFGLPPLPEVRPEMDAPFSGSFINAFPALRPPGLPTPNAVMGPPPGLVFNHTSTRPIFDPMASRASPVERQTSGPSYMGSFNPFSEGGEGAQRGLARPMYSPTGDDETPKVSRFGFARGRRGSSNVAPSSTTSPMHAPAALGHLDPGGVSGTPFYSSDAPSASPAQLSAPWPFGVGASGSQTNSPQVAHAQAQLTYAPQPTRYQSFDQSLSEAQLRDFIQSSHRGRATPAHSSSIGQRSSNASPFPPGIGQQFNDPAIMSAGFMSGMRGPPGVHSQNAAPYMDFANQAIIGGQQQGLSSPALPYGMPPGLSFRQGGAPGSVMSSLHGGSGPPTNMDLSQANSAHVSTTTSPIASSPVAFSTSDFPALPSDAPPPSAPSTEPATPAEPADAEAPPNVDEKALLKAERKAAKKAAAAERAAERAKVAQEKAAARALEKTRVAAEKVAERERAAAAKAEKEKLEKERVERETAERTKERAERAERERVERERVEAEKAAAKAAIEEKVAQAKKLAEEKRKGKVAAAAASSSMPPPKTIPSAAPAAQVPILSKMPKKTRPTAKPIRIPKEDESVHDPGSTVQSATTTEAPSSFPSARAISAGEAFSTNSRAQSVDRMQFGEPATLEDLLDEIDMRQPWMNLLDHPFFDISKINPAAKMPLEYGPLVHALSALSVGGGSFANNMPSGSIDNAVSSFQQLLETLTQTISDLLRLLPRTTWDDSSSFDGVLRDMLKGDDFLDDGGEDGAGREDEVAALTLALERRARWMEVQLSKLEELHRDINTAAVRAVLAFNDRGWDAHAFLPRVGQTLARFDNLGFIVDAGRATRAMSADELEAKLLVAQEAAVFAETEMRESMERMQGLRPLDDDDD